MIWVSSNLVPAASRVSFCSHPWASLRFHDILSPFRSFPYAFWPRISPSSFVRLFIRRRICLLSHLRIYSPRCLLRSPSCCPLHANDIDLFIYRIPGSPLFSLGEWKEWGVSLVTRDEQATHPHCKSGSRRVAKCCKIISNNFAVLHWQLFIFCWFIGSWFIGSDLWRWWR